MVKVPSKAQMIAKAVKGGESPERAEALFVHLVASHEGYNLAYALHYNGFAGEKAAHAFAGIEL